MNGVSVTALAAVLALTATGNGAAVDVGAYHGMALLHLNSGAANAGTNTTKLQHSDDGATNWTDVAGAAFTAVGTAASEQTLKIKKRLNEIYSQHSGQPIEVVEAALERDRYMTPEEAKAWGHIDEIVTQRDVAEMKAS